jgi:prepilin-type N-terminal cleavage/methylation domain-containing protein
VKKVNKTNTKGFTLIELLVVIAIIGILSTIAMTSLNGARKKAQDASFQGAASSVQATAIICCDTASATLQAAVAGAGTAVCSNTTSVPGTYATSLGAVTVTRNCSDAAGWALTIASAGKGTVTSMVCTETGCI